MSRSAPELIARTLVAEDTLGPSDRREPLMDMAGKEWPVLEARFTTPQAASIVEAETATILSWRRKYGMLVEGRSQFGQRGVAFNHSLLDLFLMRLAVLMIEHGIKPRDAACFVGAAHTPKRHMMGVRMLIGELLTDRRRSGLVGFHHGGSAEQPDDFVNFHLLNQDRPLREAAVRLGRVFTVVDLQSVIDHVLLKLGIEVVSKDATPRRKK